MRSTLDELTKELEELSTLVASITPVNTALSQHQNSLVRDYVSVRRRFDYAAFTVALYASFEKFIETLIAAFAQLESHRLQYTNLPPKLIKKHLSRTAEMLSRGRIGEGRYVGLTELEIVKNLFDCLSGTRPYRLNQAAVVAHDVNLRVGEIDALFAAIGIDQICDRVRKADALVEWYRRVKELNASLQDGVSAALIDERIKDLVERRNQIAHHGGSPIDLLGVDDMSDAIGFINAFSRAVFSIVVGCYLTAHHTTAEGHAELVQRQGEGPLKNGTVVVVDKPALRLFVGQPIFVPVDSTGARWGRIQSLQISGTDVQVVLPETVAPEGIGIGLDFKCPRGATLIALEADDDVVWSSP
ncbi:MAG: MAE_28990/MAE_18760 family HEPN-like nuclease [Burkholderiaceae bacterium]